MGLNQLSSSEHEDKKEEFVDFLNKNLSKSMAKIGKVSLSDEGGSSQEVDGIEEQVDTNVLVKELSKSVKSFMNTDKPKQTRRPSLKKISSEDSVCPLVLEAIEHQKSMALDKSSDSHHEDKKEEFVDFLNKNLSKSMAKIGRVSLSDEGGSSQEVD